MRSSGAAGGPSRAVARRVMAVARELLPAQTLGEIISDAVCAGVYASLARCDRRHSPRRTTAAGLLPKPSAR